VSKNPGAAAFEPDFIAGLKQIFEHKVPFNEVLGLTIVSLAPKRVVGRVDMKPELVGHFAHNRLHGGVISAGLDTMGGLAVIAAIAGRHMDEPAAQRLHRFAKLGTIDLRIDYLRQGIGDHFELRAEVLRLGSRVASTRMEFLGADGELLATGAQPTSSPDLGLPRTLEAAACLFPFNSCGRMPADCFSSRTLPGIRRSLPIPRRSQP